MAQILKGKPVTEKLSQEITERISALKEKGWEPQLTVVRLGQNPNDLSYEKGILKKCEKLGIKTKVEEYEESISTEQLIAELERLNKDDKVSGVLVFRPLPKHIDEEKIRTTLDPMKDVDCMNPLNLAKIFESDFSAFVPATPMAAMKVMEHYGIELEGKTVVVMNRSLVFGRPLAMMLLKANATPVICHSRTKDIKKITNEADVCVVAIGRAKSLDKSYFNENSIIIDVGVSMAEDGKIAGDADYENLKDYVQMITPVPGGVGGMTTTILLDQVVKACELKAK